MKRFRTAFVFVMAILLVLTGCTDDPYADVEPRGSVTVRIGGNQTRSIRPEAEAGSYTIEFTRTDNQNWDVPQMAVVTSGEAHTFQNVHLGSYKITVRGYAEKDSQTTLIMEGSSEEFTVNANTNTNVSVQLGYIIDTSATGKLAVTFDWSAIGVLDGPLKEAVDNGTLMLKVKNNEGGEVANWPKPVTVTGVTGKTTASFTVDMPVRENAWDITFELCNADGVCFYELPTSAVIRKNITSVPKEGTSEGLLITSNPGGEKGVIAVHKVVVNQTTPESAVDVTLVTYDGAESLRFRITEVGVPEASASVTEPYPVTRKIDTYVVGNLAVGHSYKIEIDVKYKSGLSSGWRSYNKLVDVNTKTPVQSVALVTEGLDYVMDTKGTAFTVKANLNPVAATVKGGQWTFSSADVFLADGVAVQGPIVRTAENGVFSITLQPAKPGKTTVTITSDENFERANIFATSEEFTVKLAAPVNVTAKKEAEGLGIALTWEKGDEFASSYEIQRKAGQGTFKTLVKVSSETFSYVDKALTGGESYSYQVIAVHSDASLNSVPSAVTAPVAAVRVATPEITGSTLQKGSKGILLDWTDTDPLADTFIIDRAVNGSWTNDWKTLVSVNEYLDADLTVGSTYQYRIRAKSSTYAEGDFTSADSASTASVCAEIVTPVAVAATLDSDGMGITVTWTPGEKSIATSYIVERFVDGAWTENYGTAVDGTFTDKNIAVGKTYQYRIKGVNEFYGDSFNSVVSSIATVMVEARDTVVTVLPPQNGETITLEGKGAVKTVTRETPLEIVIQDGIPGAGSYTWTLDGMVLDGFTGNTVTVTYDDCVTAASATTSRNNHVLRVKTDNGVSAAYRFNTEFFDMKVSVDDLRLPLTAVKDPIYLWVESNDETSYTFEVVSASINGEPVEDSNAVATLDPSGILKVNGFGDITIKAIAADGLRTDETAFSFYNPTVTSEKQLLEAVNKAIMNDMSRLADNFGDDWWFENVAWADKTFTETRKDGTEVGKIERMKGSSDKGPAWLQISPRTLTVDSIGEITIKSEKIALTVSGSSMTGANPIANVGSASDISGYNHIVVTLPGNQGKATIRLKEISYKPQATPQNELKGTFTVEFDRPSGNYGPEGYGIKAFNPVVFNNSEVTNRVIVDENTENWP